MVKGRAERRLTTILAADIVGSSVVVVVACKREPRTIPRRIRLHRFTRPSRTTRRKQRQPRRTPKHPLFRVSTYKIAYPRVGTGVASTWQFSCEGGARLPIHVPSEPCMGVLFIQSG